MSLANGENCEEKLNRLLSMDSKMEAVFADLNEVKDVQLLKQ
jgi:hypothetical protein